MGCSQVWEPRPSLFSRRRVKRGGHLPRFPRQGRAPIPRCPPESAGRGRGRPYRGGTGYRETFRPSRRPAAPSAAGRWGCAPGRAGQRHGARLGAAHLLGKEKAAVRRAWRPRPPSRLHHLPAAGPRRPPSGRRGRRAERSSVAMAAGTHRRPREGARGGRRPQTCPAAERPEGPLKEKNRSSDRRGPYR